MTPRHLFRSLACTLPLLVLSLASSNVALSQTAAPGSAELAPEARTRLAQAAEDARLAPWQRDLRLRLARTGTVAEPNLPAAELRAARPTLASAAADGAWNELVVHVRYNHSAIYDPVRDRMVVFGGYSSGEGLLNEVWTLGWSTTAAVGDPEAQPVISGLRLPAPNPARGATAVSFTLAQPGRVQLGIYDVGGRLVRRLVDGERRAGAETVVWNGTDESGARIGAGVYFVRLTGPGFRETRRVILLR
jgi:hypothetical protein